MSKFAFIGGPETVTLIGALHLGAPVVIGDLLITDSQGPVGFRKKVHILNDSLAVAWTGHEIAAHQALEHLKQAVTNAGASLPVIEAALCGDLAEQIKPFDLQLLGWVLGDSAVCWRWRADHPHMLFCEGPHIAGSGTTSFEKFYGDEAVSLKSSSDGGESAAVEASIMAAAHLLADEVGPRIFHAHGFGGAYEVAIARAAGFEYLSGVLYLFLSVHFDSDGGIQAIVPADRVFHTAAFHEHSLVTVLTGLQGSLQGIVRCDAVPVAANHVVKDGEATHVNAVSVESRMATIANPAYTCVIAQLFIPDAPPPPLGAAYRLGRVYVGAEEADVRLVRAKPPVTRENPAVRIFAEPRFQSWLQAMRLKFLEGHA